MQRGVKDLDVYQDPHRSIHLVVGLVAAGLTVGLLVLLPQIQNLFPTQNALVLRLFVFILAGASGVLAVRMGMAAAFAGLAKRQTIVVWRNLLAWALYVLLF